MKMKSVKIDMYVLDLDLMFVLLELAIFGSDTVNMKWKWSCFVAEKIPQRIFSTLYFYCLTQMLQ